MKVEVEELSSVEKKLKVEIPAERVKDEFELAFKEVQKTARIKGFRPGKAPMRLVEQQYRDYVHAKVLRKLLEETFDAALDRKQIKPLLEPVVDFGELKENEPFCYTISVEVKPDVVLKQYQGLEMEQEEYEITEEMVEKALHNLRERQAIFQEPKEQRGAQKDDLLVLDIKAQLDGKEIPGEGGAGIEYILGQKTYIPGFENEISGIKIGEGRTFRVKFPQDHPRTELAGKEIEYKAELKSMKEKVLPELNDDFAKEVMGCKDLSELREKTKKMLSDYYERISRAKLVRNLLDKLVELNPVEAPKGLVRKYAEGNAKNFLNRIGIKNPSEEDLKQLIEESIPKVEKEVKAGFIVQAVIEKHGIKLEPEEEEKRLKELSERYQIDPSKLKDQIGKEVMEGLRREWLEDKALDFLLSETKIIERKMVPDEKQIDEGNE